jgi:hypothetical protein
MAMIRKGQPFTLCFMQLDLVGEGQSEAQFHTQLHHPLDAQYDSIVDEPQLS